eukprot:CAMPEP_0197928428 /NCGR_PEP_ID=MMETSP1439-20131203/102322_1 /TAXON_ID=66791 /ORGANISM="Gonyaulax spinifera, Strain CCMP409" /LENGTH=199 /DNA_ID=CAMNT_0043551035 /DNA_START=51 /DNA_END=646 /DNA_ORIENTATION=-
MWYRAPELIMGQRRYTTSVDMWSVGCVFGELFTRKPLFEGKSELHQLTVIYELTGVPTEETWPGYEALPPPPAVQAQAVDAQVARRLPARRQRLGHGPGADAVAPHLLPRAAPHCGGGDRGPILLGEAIRLGARDDADVHGHQLHWTRATACHSPVVLIGDRGVKVPGRRAAGGPREALSRAASAGRGACGWHAQIGLM